MQMDDEPKDKDNGDENNQPIIPNVTTSVSQQGDTDIKNDADDENITESDDNEVDNDENNNIVITDPKLDTDMVKDDFIVPELSPDELEQSKLKLERLDVRDGQATTVDYTSNNDNIYLLKPLVSFPKEGDPRGMITNAIDWPFNKVCYIIF